MEAGVTGKNEANTQEEEKFGVVPQRRGH